MIDNISECSADEIEAQIQYLAWTPVAAIAKLLLNQQAVLKNGVLRSLKYLGTLKTEFGEVSSLVPQTTSGERKFRVAELLGLLKRSDRPDNELLSKVETFIAMDERGIVNYNITILSHAGE